MPCIYPLIMPYDPGTTATLATGPVGPTLPYNPYMAPNPGYNPYQGLPGSIPMSGLNGFKDADWDEDKQLMLNAILVGSVMGGIFYRSKPSTGMLIGALSFYLLKTTGWVR